MEDKLRLFAMKWIRGRFLDILQTKDLTYRRAEGQGEGFLLPGLSVSLQYRVRAVNPLGRGPFSALAEVLAGRILVQRSHLLADRSRMKGGLQFDLISVLQQQQQEMQQMQQREADERQKQKLQQDQEDGKGKEKDPKENDEKDQVNAEDDWFAKLAELCPFKKDSS